ncbi:MAG: hypothetical protein ACHQF2_01885 [Flavobacteriales bacterium]
MGLRILITLLFLSFISESKPQGEYGTRLNANIGLAVGYSGFNRNMLEVGVGFQPWDVEGTFVAFPFAGFLAMYEFEPHGRLYGTSFNAWYLSGPFSCGLNVNRYSDYENHTFGIKPMVGISIARLGIMFGYNFFLNENRILDFYHPSFIVRFYVPVWKRKDLPHDFSY